MSNTLKEAVQAKSDAELEALSLAETLSIEEAVCDAVDGPFLLETADLPLSTSPGALPSSSEFDKYQIWNQNYIGGVDEEDLHDMLDPDDQDAGAIHAIPEVEDEAIEDSEQDLTEAMVPGGPGALNHNAITRNAADLNNPDIGIQTTDIPEDFDTILTAGSMLRRKVDMPSAELAGVPMSLDDVLAGKLAPTIPAEEIEGKRSKSENRGSEAPALIDHPVASHQNGTLKEMVEFLLESDDEDDDEDFDFGSDESAEDEDDEDDDGEFADTGSSVDDISDDDLDALLDD